MNKRTNSRFIIKCIIYTKKYQFLRERERDREREARTAAGGGDEREGAVDLQGSIKAIARVRRGGRQGVVEDGWAWSKRSLYSRRWWRRRRGCRWFAEVDEGDSRGSQGRTAGRGRRGG
ncbi:hypothetical protein QJS04_geneDACA016559 [Acorus gramineus]|uniref:Uncharacterized protein n=1 Tax=Acorus gramineus TaxID=55184 RepID=A0AAV9BP36_ACOGR|nr:hypothetical protein QJS04_geneDACA016559 [Acorus gramineus]